MTKAKEYQLSLNGRRILRRDSRVKSPRTEDRPPRINAWKIAPGEGASHWKMCREKKCILLGWRKLKDYRSKNEKQIRRVLGGGPGNGTGAARSVLRFANEIQISDIIIANRGRSGIVGIGVVTSEYLPPKSPKNPSESKALPHARLVDWVVDQPIEFDNYFFSPPTVHALTVEKLGQIKQAYLKRYPKLKKTLDGLFDRASTTNLDQGVDEVEQIALESLEKEQAKGQGFLLNKELRLALEKYAMDAAKAYFKSSRFVVDDHSKNHPYDLYCRRGKQALYVEVKGTKNAAEKIILTDGEVKFARRHKGQMALFILHSIEVRRDAQLKGGRQRLIRRWDVDQGRLSPLAFMYQPQGR
jgi:hypothetical protein